ncbi:helix-turn-helix domain-containing protein [Nocardia cyriacigeorgica]|uniref:helix-turn-helix domain-containing protein n=1 Tax=Nocardia cyriacigeorgica TaxID=135487 RepID=UPI0018947737|nr:helix-turn-helix transcriptional regulator [Nocardia cyriacigeorgica]MBF6098302.1 helix-turn-helix domain-containing protein [Nocardia cyriacigeorgica]
MTASSTTTNSTLPRRILAGLLREKRIAAGISVEAARQAIGVSKQTFWRMETGQPTKINPLFISHLAQMYRVDDETADIFLALVEETHAKGWWHAFGDSIPRDFDLYIGLQDAAKRLSSYHTILLPGILQTTEYRREIHWAEFPGMPSDEIEQRLQLHVERRARLYDPERPLTVDTFLDEALLRRMVGSSEVMAGQLRHLLELDLLPNVSIRVVPMTARRHKGILTGAFVLLEFPRHPTANLTEPPVVYIEQYTGALYLEKPDEVQQYRAAYADIQRVTLDQEGSRRLIQQLADELSSE